MAHTIVLGLQFGDESKAAMTDRFAKKHDIVVRHNGGGNAGHTVIHNGEKTVFHTVPCGILSGKESFIGNGVFFDPNTFLEEVVMLRNKGLDTSLIKVSENAHVVMPYHIDLDCKREEQFKIGTTKRGIGPCAQDKYGRVGIQVKDLFNWKILTSKIYNRNVQACDYSYSISTLADEYCEKFAWIEDHVVSSIYLQSKENILFEGAQSTLLDVDHGYYPFVTSSNCVADQVGIGSGISLLNKKVNVVGVFKPYITKVGTGPYPTNMEETHPNIAEHIRKVGKEWGATTGRPRHIGWLNLQELDYACKLNGVTELAIAKSDVVCGLKEIIVRDVNGEDNWLDGWNFLDDRNFKHFLNYIEKSVNIPIKYISTGPERHQMLLRNEL